MWTSEDIWVRNQQDGFANQIHQNAEYQVTPNPQPVFIYVRIRNRGFVNSLGIEQIQLSWAKASTALTWPDYWEGTLDLDPGTNFAVAGNLVGIKTLTDPIGPMDQQIIEFEWFPPNPEAYKNINSEPWHFCLLARIIDDNDPMNETSDLNENVKNNNNIAWKNISIVDEIDGLPVGPGENECRDYTLKLGRAVAVTNPFNQPETFDIEFATPREDLGPAVFGPTLPFENVYGEIRSFTVGMVPESPNPITANGNVLITLDDRLYEKWVKGGRKSTGISEIIGVNMSETGLINNRINNHAPIDLANRKYFEVVGVTASFNNIKLDPKETHSASLRVLYPTEPISDKQSFKYDIIQKKSDNEKIIGGVRYDIRKPDCSIHTINAGSDKTINKGCSINLISSSQVTCTRIWWMDASGNILGENSILNVSPSLTTEYTLKSLTPGGCVSEDKVTVFVNKQLCAREREIIIINPNPAKERVTIKYRASNTNNAHIKIVKADNSFERNYNLNLQTDEIQLDVSQYPMGAYGVVLVADGIISDRKTLMIIK